MLVGMHDSTAIRAIQTSLAVLLEGSVVAAKAPCIARIAGLLRKALTMQDVRLTHISDNLCSNECH
jgi:hypothetical protein